MNLKMKNKYLFLILFGLIIYTGIYITSSHKTTVHTMNSIRLLNGMSLTRNELNKRLHKSYSELKNKKEITRFSKYMSVNIPENATLYKITGKGLPYYYGAIVLDTLNNKIINVVIRELK